MIHFFRKINFGLFLVLLVVFLLRLPSLWEPYWYGDEGIYLAIGQAIQRGAVLYRDIWDNKPPLLYLLYALHPTLLWAKFSATLFVLATCLAVYRLSRLLFTNHQSNHLSLSTNHQSFFPLLTTIICGILLSLPLLEGTIANAELYFTTCIVWGGYFIYKDVILGRSETTTPESLVSFQRKLESSGTSGSRVKPGMTGIVIGLLLSAAFFLKVPAIFDFMGMFLAVGLITKTKYLITQFFFPITITFVSLLTTVVLYFYLNHGLSDFLTASFFQNASYVAIDTGPLSKLSNPLFLRGLLLLLSSLALLVLFIKKYISREFLFLSLWFGFSVYGALLSNRPYMHYLLQIVPPAVLLLTCLSSWLAQDLQTFLRDSGHSASRRIARMTSVICIIVFLQIIYSLARFFSGAFALDAKLYYQNWFNYVSHRKTWEEYVSAFDPRTLNSYKVAEYLIQNTEYSDPVFVWGDAAFVYVLSNRPPATKFIQAHHLTTIDPENYNYIIGRLEKLKPKYILVSRPVHFQFPRLEILLKKGYQKTAVFEDLNLYSINYQK